MTDKAKKMDGQKLSLEIQLDRVELKLKSLDRWAKAVGILGSAIGILVMVLNIWIWRYQNRLAKFQSEEEAQKHFVSVELKLEAQLVPGNPPRVYAIAKYKNDSARQISIGMFGVRLWKDWSEGTTPLTKPDRLIFADMRLNSCPSDFCPKEGTNFRLQRFDSPVLLPAHQSYELTYGPYELPQGLKSYWLEGVAYTREQDDGACAIAGPPLRDGGFPAYCDEQKLQIKDCYNLDDCKFARSRATLYVLP